MWSTIPPITFTQGIAASVSIAAFVRDPENDALSITVNAAALPPGVTFDASGARFIYDGIGAVMSTNDHILTADDGKEA